MEGSMATGVSDAISHARLLACLLACLLVCLLACCTKPLAPETEWDTAEGGKVRSMKAICTLWQIFDGETIVTEESLLNETDFPHY